MRTLSLAAALAGALIATPALAQTDTSGATAPDGSPAFGIEPYVGVMGGYDDFDSDNRGQITTNCNGRSGCADGGYVEGVLGVNVPLGPGFVGVEGTAAKGFNGIDYFYGAWGRAGLRAGLPGMVYGKVGYQWVHTDENHQKRFDREVSYGLGVEVGPKFIGLGGVTPGSFAGARLRLEVNTLNFKDIRPGAGLIFHF